MANKYVELWLENSQS